MSCMMGTFGYVAPEYACTGMLTEKSDVYNFGILIMEIITERSPVDYSKPHGERNSSIRTFLKSHFQRPLSFALLGALKCVDPDATKRHKIGHIIHMLEADEILFRDERRTGGKPLRSHRNYHHEQKDSSRGRKRIGREITDRSEDDNSSKNLVYPTRLR
ncbi:hypothetical protein HN51_041557 [Arachis hypogaea]